MPVAVGRPLDRGVYVIDGQLHDAIEGRATPVLDLRPITSLRGAHNWQNAAAAYGAVRALGLAPEAIAAGLPHFQGLRSPPGAGRHDRWRAVRQRQQGDQPRRRGAGAVELRGHLLDRRRAAQGRRARSGPALAGSRAPRLSDRRGGRRASPGRSQARIPCTQSGDLPTALAPGREAPRGRIAAAVRWFCWPRPAPRSTSSAISRSAARPSRRWSPSSSAGR